MIRLRSKTAAMFASAIVLVASAVAWPQTGAAQDGLEPGVYELRLKIDGIDDERAITSILLKLTRPDSDEASDRFHLADASIPFAGSLNVPSYPYEFNGILAGDAVRFGGTFIENEHLMSTHFVGERQQRGRTEGRATGFRDGEIVYTATWSVRRLTDAEIHKAGVARRIQNSTAGLQQFVTSGPAADPLQRLYRHALSQLDDLDADALANPQMLGISLAPGPESISFSAMWMADEPDAAAIRLKVPDGETVQIDFEDEEVQAWFDDSEALVVYQVLREFEPRSPEGRLISAAETGDLVVELLRNGQVVDTTDNVFRTSVEDD